MSATATSRVVLLVLNQNGGIEDQHIVMDAGYENLGIKSDGELTRPGKDSPVMKRVGNGYVVYLALSDDDFYRLSKDGWEDLKGAGSEVRGLISIARKEVLNYT